MANVKAAVIDSPAPVFDVICETLRGWGIECRPIASAAEAVTLLSGGMDAQYRPDVALIDASLTDMTAAKLASELRAGGLPTKTRILLLESSGGREDSSVADVWFSACLVMPVKKARLYSVMLTALGRQKEQEEPLSPRRRRRDTHGLAAITRQPILVVDDHTVNQKVATMLLRELGLVAHAVGSGAEALEAMSRIQYALVFMDCQMPEMDGFETTRRIRESESGTEGHVTIIAMTANAMEGDREACLAAGMDDYLSKPVNQKRLKETLDRWLPTILPAVQAGLHEDSALSGQEAPGLGALSFLAEFRETCGDEAAAKILDAFLNTTPQLLDKLDESVGQKDAIAARRAAHKLKGACAMIGSTDMADHCQSLEKAAVSQDWSTTANHLESLRNCWEDFEKTARSAMDTGGKS